MDMLFIYIIAAVVFSIYVISIIISIKRSHTLPDDFELDEDDKININKEQTKSK